MLWRRLFGAPKRVTEDDAVAMFLQAMVEGRSFTYPDGDYSQDRAHSRAYAIIDAETADFEWDTYSDRVREWRRRARERGYITILPHHQPEEQP